MLNNGLIQPVPLKRTTKLRWLLWLSLSLPATLASAGELLAAVAANFTGAAREIATRFEAQTGHQLKISYGSSGKLFAQIEQGAPFEVYLAADALLPQRAIDNGLALADSRFSYARGRLVLWSLQPGLFSDGAAYLRDLSSQRIAIANPKTAPYGLAAQQTLSQLALWERLQPRLVYGDSVAQAFQFAATGNTTLGFVAHSQVSAWRGEPGSLWVIPDDYYPAIDQQAVLLNRGQHNPVATQFLEFLKGADAQRIILAHGYLLPN